MAASTASWLLHAPQAVQFLLAGAALIPLAGLLGLATEELAKHRGPLVGGLLNATFGNAGELIIALAALREGYLDLVKASITGSIIGNLLLVLGLAIGAGGLRYRIQTFNRTAAGVNASMLVMAVIGLLVPALFSWITSHHAARSEFLSLGVAGVLLVLYAASLIFSLVTHRHLFVPEEEAEPEAAQWSQGRAFLLLLVTTAAVILESEILVHALEGAVHAFGFGHLFVGVVVVGMVGNCAEHAAAVRMAHRNKVDLAFTIAVGSSTQVALFVAPVLVFASLFLGHPMDLVFHPFEVLSVFLSVMIVNLLTSDGETHWFEGLQLLGVYSILAWAFYWL